MWTVIYESVSAHFGVFATHPIRPRKDLIQLIFCCVKKSSSSPFAYEIITYYLFPSVVSVDNITHRITQFTVRWWCALFCIYEQTVLWYSVSCLLIARLFLLQVFRLPVGLFGILFITYDCANDNHKNGCDVIVFVGLDGLCYDWAWELGYGAAIGNIVRLVSRLQNG